MFSGYDDSGPSYGRFCGNQVPPEIISVDEALLLRFKSDDTINSKGFFAAFSVIDDSNEFEYEDYDGDGGAGYVRVDLHLHLIFLNRRQINVANYRLGTV